MSSINEVHCSLSKSATPNTAWTDNPAYWNKYERAAVGLPDDVSHLAVTCLTCSDKFVPEVTGQSFCSEECYVPPCSICHDELAFLNGDQPNTRGMPLCAGCYWDAEEEMRYQRAQAFWNQHTNSNAGVSGGSSNAASGGAGAPPEGGEEEEETSAAAGRHNKTERHSSSSNSTPPPPPSPALVSQPEVQYIFPGEPEYDDRALDDWESTDEEEREERESKQHNAFNKKVHSLFSKSAIDKRIAELKKQIAARDAAKRRAETL